MAAIIQRQTALVFLLCLVVYSTSSALSDPPSPRKTAIKLWEFPRWEEEWRDSNKPDRVITSRFTWIRRKIHEFETLHPEVTVQLTELSWQGGADKKRIALLASAGPDIATGTIPILEIEAGKVEPVDDAMLDTDREDYLPLALEAFRYAPQQSNVGADLNVRPDPRVRPNFVSGADTLVCPYTWGWPWYLTGNLLFLNLDIFNERGVQPPPQGQWTWSEFIDVSKRLTFDRDGDGNIDVYGFGFYSQPGETALWSLLGPPPNANPFDLISGVSLRRLGDLVRAHKVVHPQTGGMTADALWQAFRYRHSVAIAPFGVWALPDLLKGGEDNFPFTVAGFPSDDPARSGSTVAVSGFIVFKQADPEKRRLCHELCRFLTSPEAQRDLSKYGVFPARVSAEEIYADPKMIAAGELLASGSALPKVLHWAQVDEYLQRQAQLYLLGSKGESELAADFHKFLSEKLLPAEAPTTRKAVGRPAVWLIAGLLICAVLFWADRRDRTHFSLLPSYLFVAPAAILFFVFLVYPIIKGVLLAFQSVDTLDLSLTRWVGLQNFRETLADAVFRKSLLNTVVYSAVVVPTRVLTALVLASLLFPLGKRLTAFFRGAYYLPSVVSLVAISMVWRWYFDEDAGLLNTILAMLGASPVPWLSSPNVALSSIILMNVLLPPGAAIIIYHAAMSTIPASLHEAAMMDGAGPINRWWHITVPMLRPTTFFLLVTVTAASFQVFTAVLMLTDGGPGFSTSVMVHRIFTLAFRDVEFGLASAAAVVLFLIILGISVTQRLMLRRAE